MKTNIYFITIIIGYLLLEAGSVIAQNIYSQYKLGPYSSRHRFKALPKQNNDSCICHHHFIPKKRKIKAYTAYGRSFTLYKADTLSVYLPLYTGEYGGKRGTWIEISSSGNPYHNYPSGYVFFSELKDIEKEVKADEIKKAKALQELHQAERDKQLKSFFSYLPYIIAFISIFFLLDRLSSKTKVRNNLLPESKTRRKINIWSNDINHSPSNDTNNYRSENDSPQIQSWIGSDEFNRQIEESRKRQDHERMVRSLESEIYRLENKSDISFWEQQELYRLKNEHSSKRWYGI